jgi:hypothetical protein
MKANVSIERGKGVLGKRKKKKRKEIWLNVNKMRKKELGMDLNVIAEVIIMFDGNVVLSER